MQLTTTTSLAAAGTPPLAPGRRDESLTPGLSIIYDATALGLIVTAGSILVSQIIAGICQTGRTLWATLPLAAINSGSQTGTNTSPGKTALSGWIVLQRLPPDRTDRVSATGTTSRPAREYFTSDETNGD